MSFILDALKKSESDRQRQSGPALFEVKVAPPKARFPVWAIAIVALLAVNMVIVAWMLLRRSPHSDETAAANNQPAAASGVPSPTDRNPSNNGGYGPNGPPATTGASANYGTQGPQYGGPPGPQYGNQSNAARGQFGPPANQQGNASGESRLPERDQNEPTLASNGRDASGGQNFAATRDANNGRDPGGERNFGDPRDPGADPAANTRATGPTRDIGTGSAANPGSNRDIGTGSAANPGSNRDIGTGSAANPGPTRDMGTGSAANAGGSRDTGAGPAANARAPAPESSTNPDDYAPASEPGSSLFKGHVRRGTESGLVLYQDAALAPGANIPQLRLDLHVYAAKPQDRFALINMRRLHEGDSLPDGVRVEAITPDGVVMSHNGSKFLLPRE